jgi:hypothetical protein
MHREQWYGTEPAPNPSALRRNDMTKALWPLATLATLAVIVAGCGNGSAGTGNSTDTSGGNNAASIHEEALKFAECMRSHGVSAFPDPDTSGLFTIDGVVNGSSLNPNSPTFTRAIAACKNLEPPGFTGARVTAQQTTARLKFAQCVRQNGVPDFPDPTPNGPLVDTNRVPSAGTTAGMGALNAAMHKCGAIYSGELGLNRQ